MDRTTNSLANFAINFLLGYALGSLVRDRRTGVGAGLLLGLVGAVGSWLVHDRFEELDVDDDRELVEIEV
jgi:hypothetical protein